MKATTTGGESAGVASACPDADRRKVEGVLQTYETALKAAATDKVMSLYASDGVFMPQHGPSSIESAALIKNARPAKVRLAHRDSAQRRVLSNPLKWEWQ